MCTSYMYIHTELNIGDVPTQFESELYTQRENNLYYTYFKRWAIIDDMVYTCMLDIMDDVVQSKMARYTENKYVYVLQLFLLV